MGEDRVASFRTGTYVCTLQYLIPAQQPILFGTIQEEAVLIDQPPLLGRLMLNEMESMKQRDTLYSFSLSLISFLLSSLLFSPHLSSPLLSPLLSPHLFSIPFSLSLKVSGRGPLL
jgi:hypothetical protein